MAMMRKLSTIVIVTKMILVMCCIRIKYFEFTIRVMELNTIKDLTKKHILSANSTDENGTKPVLGMMVLLTARRVA